MEAEYVETVKKHLVVVVARRSAEQPRKSMRFELRGVQSLTNVFDTAPNLPAME